MWRLLMIFSILPIGAALLLRWWFGTRVLTALGGRPCRCDQARWDHALGDSPLMPASQDAPAGEYGYRLRLAALAQWQRDDRKRAAAREASRRFGWAVPPFSAMVAVFALILAKIPPQGAITIFIAATALATAFGLLTLGEELRAISRAARALREARAFIRSDDEDAVIQAAVARAWCEALPRVLQML